MKILVTGSEGFIGQHVIKIAEQRGHEVFGIDHKISWGVHDYSSETYEKFDAVIHLAALIDIKESFEKPWEYIENNLMSIKSLCNAHRVVLASSAAVYGNFSPYGYTKRLAEAVLPENSISLRLFNPFGPGENHNPETHIIPLLAESIVNKTGITLFQGGNQVRSFIDVRDVADAFVRAAESNLTGTYDLCDEELTIRNVADLMGADYALEKSLRDPGDTDRLVGEAWRLQEALHWEPMHNVKKELRHWRNWYGK